MFRRSGTLYKWLDSRGFGFIKQDQPDQLPQQEFFFNIARLGKGSVRPFQGCRVSFVPSEEKGRGDLSQANNVVVLANTTKMMGGLATLAGKETKKQ